MSDRRLAALLVLPALGAILLVAVFPLGWTAWESLHQHDLRMPWLGRPYVGVRNYAAILHDARFGGALAHTAFFALVTVTLELGIGLAAALAMHRAFRGRGVARAAVLLPWAIPTVVAGLLARFAFQSPGGLVDSLLAGSGLSGGPVAWLADPRLAWLPLILADVWKTAPFVALLLLAGLQNIDATLYEAAAIDGAGRWWQLRHVTLPLLQPAIVVALIFRTLDAFRVFDLVYVLTGGGPGTATETVALYTFATLFEDLAFGYGAALAVVMFAVTFALALLYIRWLGEAGPRPEGSR